MATSDRGAKRVLGKRKAGQHPAAGAPKPKERTLAPARAVCEPEATSAPNSDSAEDEQHGDEEEEYVRVRVPGARQRVLLEARGQRWLAGLELSRLAQCTAALSRGRSRAQSWGWCPRACAALAE